MKQSSNRFLEMWIVTALVLTSIGCVKKPLYDKALSDIDALTQEKSSLNENLTACQLEAEALEANLKETRTQLQLAEKEIGKLTTKSSTLATNLDESQKAVEEMRQRAQQQEERLRTYRELISRFRQLIEGGKLDVQVVRGRLVVKLGEGILFDSGSAALKSSGQAVLAEVNQVLSAIPNRNFQIEGHTDNLPTRSSSQYASNWELSAARAISVVKYMIEQGMDPTRLSAAGYGEQTPVVPNDTADLRALNRRIEIVLMPNLDELPSFDEFNKIQ